MRTSVDHILLVLLAALLVIFLLLFAFFAAVDVVTYLSPAWVGDFETLVILGFLGWMALGFVFIVMFLVAGVDMRKVVAIRFLPRPLWLPLLAYTAYAILMFFRRGQALGGQTAFLSLFYLAQAVNVWAVLCIVRDRVRES